MAEQKTPKSVSMFPSSWSEFLDPEINKIYMKNLLLFLEQEIKNKKAIAPKGSQFFRALKEVPYEKVKVVIIGQDPYPTEGHANGLAFAVNGNVKAPRSLQNIFKEIASDLNVPAPHDPTLLGWAEQGVLLLNTVLTVRLGEPASHRKHGWEQLTDRIIKVLNDRPEPIVFILWGGDAQKKREIISNPRHKVIQAAHPSPLSASRGFFGSKVFSKTNALLQEMGLAVIDWARTGKTPKEPKA